WSRRALLAAVAAGGRGSGYFPAAGQLKRLPQAVLPVREVLLVSRVRPLPSLWWVWQGAPPAFQASPSPFLGRARRVMSLPDRNRSALRLRQARLEAFPPSP